MKVFFKSVLIIGTLFAIATANVNAEGFIPPTIIPSRGTCDIAAGDQYSVAVDVCGDVLYTEQIKQYSNYENPIEGLDDWSDIVQISVSPRPNAHTVGLKSDGTVVAIGYNSTGACEVSDWTDIVKVASGTYTTVGLKSDGTVVATPITKDNFDFGQADVSSYTDIVDIAAGRYFTALLHNDGTVSFLYNPKTSLSIVGNPNTSNWTDIVAISAGHYHLLGIKSDGTVVATGGDESVGMNNVSSWKNVIKVSAGANHSLALTSDGKCLAVGKDLVNDGDKQMMQIDPSLYYSIVNDVKNYSNIVDIACGENHNVVLRSDGQVLTNGYSLPTDNRHSASNWTLWDKNPEVIRLEENIFQNTASSTFKIKNRTNHKLKATIVMVFYDKNNTPLENSVFYNDFTFDVGKSDTLSSLIQGIPQGTKTIKWFVWEKNGSIRSLSGVYTKEL